MTSRKVSKEIKKLGRLYRLVEIITGKIIIENNIGVKFKEIISYF